MNWEGLNRRKFPRVSYPCLVTVWMKGDDDKEMFLTHTDNLGAGGAAIHCHRRLKLFDPVELEIDLLDLEEHLRCRGKVVWCVQRKERDPHKAFNFDVGVEFEEIQEKDKERISKIVEHLRRNQKIIS